MNYLLEINAFYNWLETNSLSPGAVNLWHALMATANKAGWADKFSVAVSVLEIKTGLNKRTIERARVELCKAGRIEWRRRMGNKSAIYCMVSFYDDARQVATAKTTAADSAAPKPGKVQAARGADSTNDKNSRFVRPTLEDVRQYCTERNNRVDAVKFINHYEANGWMIGKTRMKDWRAAVRTWEGRSDPMRAGPFKHPFTNYGANNNLINDERW